MALIKTSELTDIALDYAVAVLLYGESRIVIKECLRDDGFTFFVTAKTNPNLSKSFSIDWESCGPIIERERINISEDIHPILDWTAIIYVEDSEPWQYPGSTPLEAAMRCYVASKFGDTVEIPDELLN
jgi:hypothetical protein